MRGRKPLPAALHILQGTYRADRHGGTPEVAVEIPKPPRDLDKRRGPHGATMPRSWLKCEPSGLPTGRPLRATAPRSAARERAEEELAKTAPLVKSPSGYPVQNPWFAIANKSDGADVEVGSRTRAVARGTARESRLHQGKWRLFRTGMRREVG